MRCVPLLLLIAFATSLRAEDWREFRGPSGQGLYEGKNLPIEWSTTKNVAWKTKIPGKGWSSPIIEKGRVYLTSAVPIDESKDLSLAAICVDAATGKVIWRTDIFKQDAKAPKIHAKNSHASPTPVTDGKHLFVHFGHQGTACLDLDGKIVWRSTEHRYSPVHGNGGTPIFAGDKLVFSVDGSDKQLIIALDKATGKTKWKTPRKTDFGQKFSFSTPLLIATPDGKEQIISPGSGVVCALDPADGKEIWRCSYDGYSVIPRPVFGHGMIYIGSGYNTPSVYAIKVDGRGDVTKTHIAWSVQKGAPHTPSLLLMGDELYMVSDGGLASCLDAKTGKAHWQERVSGKYSASPFYADGKVYLQSEEGVTTVLRAGKTHELLATSNLKERTFACYAVADGAIYLRTETQLYRIQSK
jgi:outer membrane protein assembly factor BamB